MARTSKSSSIAVIILSSVSIQQCSSFAPKIHSNRRFNCAPVSYTDRLPLLYAKSEGEEETSGDASVTTPIENVLKISKNTKEKNKASYEDQEKIFLWLQKGRRVEAIRDESDDIQNNSQNDGTKARALTSGAARFEGRYSASDWAHNAFTLRTSTVLREIRSPILFMTGWATLISIVHKMLLTRRPMWAIHMCISDKPHSLMVSALSLLLVFRTNSAYQRFAEGRKIWERILTHSRDLTRSMLLFEEQIGVDKRRRVQRLLAAFPYLLRHRIRPNLRMRRLKETSDFERDPENTILLYDDSALFDDDENAATVASDEEEKGTSRRKTRELYWVDKRSLPWRLLPGSALAACARAQNRPLWVCDRMAKELVTTPDQEGFTNRERMMLLNLVDKISHTIGECERIHQTVVPLNYARHCLRGVTLWLLSLPFALVGQLGLLTGPVLSVMSWLLYGIYQIGYNIEDPFQSTLRLSILCDAVRRDVFAEEILQRDTAFVVDNDVSEDADDDESTLEREGDLIDEDGTVNDTPVDQNVQRAFISDSVDHDPLGGKAASEQLSDVIPSNDRGFHGQLIPVEQPSSLNGRSTNIAKKDINTVDYEDSTVSQESAFE